MTWWITSTFCSVANIQNVRNENRMILWFNEYLGRKESPDYQIELLFRKKILFWTFL